MENWFKYPKTLHVPWAPGLQNDDRDQVVEMWRDLGLKCFQCELKTGFKSQGSFDIGPECAKKMKGFVIKNS